MDIISAIEFDKTGDHLATGDRGGRVVLFERTDTKEVRFCNIKRCCFWMMQSYTLSNFLFATSMVEIEEI